MNPHPAAQRLKRLSLLLHASCISLSLSIAFTLFDSSLFSWHPLFMSLGFILFMTEGVLSAFTLRSMPPGPARVSAIQSHALMQVRSIACVIIGFAVIYRNKSIHHKAHFTSTHGQFGLLTFFLATLSPLLGAFSFKSLGLINLVPESRHGTIKWVHRRLGALTWILALATIQLGLINPSVNKGVVTQVWQAGVAVVFLLMALLATQSTPKLKIDSSSPEDQLPADQIEGKGGDLEV